MSASSLDDAHDALVGGLDVGEEVAAGGGGGAGEGLQALAVVQQARQELVGVELGVGRQGVDEAAAQSVERLDLQPTAHIIYLLIIIIIYYYLFIEGL